MDTSKFISLLDRYLNGKATPKETNLVDEWYHSFPDHEDIGPLKHPEKETLLFNKVKSTIGHHHKQAVIRRINFRVWASAAILLLITSVALLLWQGRRNGSLAVSDLVVVSTNSSGQKKIILPDSSVVWMNAATLIRFPQKFEASQRIVYLDEGEAFFEVKKNPAKPFLVYTAKLHTRVLGTSFNIKNYSQLDFIKVTVRTGRVQIGNATQNFGVYTHNQQLTYHVRDQHFVREQVLDDQSSSWRNGKVKLEQAGFNELAIAIQSVYNIRLVTADDSIKNLRYSLTIEGTQPVDEALKLINAIHETKTRRYNNRIEILK